MGSKFASRKNEPKAKPSAWRILTSYVAFKKSAPAEEKPAQANTDVQKLSVRVVPRKVRALDTSADFFTSAPWNAVINSGLQTGADEAVMEHLLKSEALTLEVQDLPRRHGIDASHEFAPAIMRSVTSRHAGGGGKASSATNAVCDSFIFSLKNLCSDHESDRARSFRNLNSWILRILFSMHWPLSCYFVAVHGMEKMLRQEMARSRFDCTQFDRTAPLTAAASLLVAVSCECSHRELTRAKAVINDLSNVNNINDVITRQLTIVANLTNGSMLLKTPVDWLSYYTARIQLYDYAIGLLIGRPDYYNSLISTNKARYGRITSELTGYFVTGRRASVPAPCLMSVTWEVCIHASLWLYLNNLHRKVEGSVFVAAIIWHMLFERQFNVQQQVDEDMETRPTLADENEQPTTTAAAGTKGSVVSPPVLTEPDRSKVSMLLFQMPYAGALQSWVSVMPKILESVQSRLWIDDFGPLLLDSAQKGALCSPSISRCSTAF